MNLQITAFVVFAIEIATFAVASNVADDQRNLLAGNFQWAASGPLIAAAPLIDKGCAIKDPSVIFHEGRWHIYATLRNENFARMEYLSFADWREADAAPRTVIALIEKYHAAPQVFFFTPQRKWYLIYQSAPLGEGGFFGPVFSTMTDVSRPQTLTAPKPMFPGKPKNVEHWLDFWVICDDTRAFLFFTGDDGRFWRSQTTLANFPLGWGEPVLVLQQAKDDFFEATHTYRLKGLDKYLTLVEAIGPKGKRYYKAFLAECLDGSWTPCASNWDKPFASINNITFVPGVTPWTDSISHGELLRDGIDEKLIVDPAHLRFLFQGCSSEERAGKKYGRFPWRLGLLEARTVR